MNRAHRSFAMLLAGGLLASACQSLPAAPDAASESDAGTAEAGVAGSTDAPGEAAAVQPTEPVTGSASISGTAAAATPQATLDPAVAALIQSFVPPSKGEEDAILTMYEVSDYLCPYCRMYTDETAAQVQAAYIDTGLLRLVYWDLPLNNHGYPAVVGAEAAHCAGEQERYWEMHDALFGAWDDLSKLDIQDEAAAQAAVVALGAGIGLDEATLRECVETRKYRPVVAVMARQALQDMQLRSTPTFIIQAGGHTELVEGFLPFEELKKVLDREIARAQGTPVADPTLPPTTVPIPTWSSSGAP